MLQKLGKADETKDEQFEQVVVNFRRQEVRERTQRTSGFILEIYHLYKVGKGMCITLTSGPLCFSYQFEKYMTQHTLSSS